MTIRHICFSIVACIITIQATRSFAQNITGKIYYDANSDGEYDPGEKGISGVGVTDGIQFVESDENGDYRLAIANNPTLRDGGVPIISISWPSGYWPSSHWFKRIDSSEAVGSFNFGLRKDKQELPFEFIHATDAHAPRGGETNLILFRKDVENLKGKVQFVIFTGDNANLADSHPYEQSKKEFQFFIEQTQQLPIPWFAVSGNHDLAGVRAKTGWTKESPDYAYGAFTRLIGPLRWSFNYAGVHFVGIDYNRYVTNTWIWGTPAEALSWLDADLKRNKPGTRTFLFVHFPEKDIGIEEVIQKHSVTQIFHGHDHQDRSWSFGGIPALSSSSLSEIFEDKDRTVGYRLARISENSIETFYRATAQPHAITIEQPRSNTMLSMNERVVGSFFDPNQKIQSLRIRIGEQEEETSFVRGPLCCRFSHAFNLEKVSEGIRPMVVSVSDGMNQWQIRQTCFVLTGNRQVWNLTNDAVIEFDLGGIEEGVDVRINSLPAGVLTKIPTQEMNVTAVTNKNNPTQVLRIPSDKLQRLNHLELIPRNQANGNTDSFFLSDLRMKYQDKVYRDIRYRFSTKTPMRIESTQRFLIDLQPGK